MTDDSTRILGSGTAAYPLDPAAAGAEEQCPHCQTLIAAGEQFCPRCGFQRGSWREGEEAAPLAAEAAEVMASRFGLEGSGGARYPLPEGTCIVGRSEDADITINDGYISRRHARFTVSEDGISIADLGSANGTFIGEERLEPEAEHDLAIGDALRLGQTELTIVETEQLVAGEGEAEAEPEETQMMTANDAELPADEERVPGELVEVHLDMKPAPSPWLLRRQGTEEVLYLPSGETLLGRKPERATLVLRGDSYISGLHCRLVASVDHLEVTDLGSTNGTYVNSERCAPDHPAALAAGDILRLGSTDLEVAYEEQADLMGGEDAGVDIAASEPQAGEDDSAAAPTEPADEDRG